MALCNALSLGNFAKSNAVLVCSHMSMCWSSISKSAKSPDWMAGPHMYGPLQKPSSLPRLAASVFMCPSYAAGNSSLVLTVPLKG